MSSFHVGCTALIGLNKSGHLKPDEDGYYTVVLGALNFRNSVGEIYTERSARAIFEQSSSFMRRMRAGYCRGEYGHPKRAQMTDDEWLVRIMTTYEDRVCMHISEVWIDMDSVKYRGAPVVAIMGKIKPSGPYGAVLKESLDNPKENVAFSVRSLTDNYYEAGIVHKDFARIEGWDFVIEPGLAPANKYANPGLESHVVLLESGDEVFTFSQEAMEQAVVRAKTNKLAKVSLESLDGLESMLRDTRQRTRLKADGHKPKSSVWK